MLTLGSHWHHADHRLDVGVASCLQPEVPVITGNSRFLFLLFVTGTTDADQRYAMAFTVARECPCPCQTARS